VNGYLGMFSANLIGALLFARNKPDETSTGMFFVFTTFLCNLMFIGVSNSTSDVPKFCYEIVPLIPVSL